MPTIDEEVVAFGSRVAEAINRFCDEKDNDVISQQYDLLEKSADKLHTEIEDRCVDPLVREQLQFRVKADLDEAKNAFFSTGDKNHFHELLDGACIEGDAILSCKNYQALRGEDEKCAICGTKRRRKI
uniref:hypothetical protein n=1 Tax=Burkholderia arboris TaxID=488730 RepID=UPI003BEF282D